MFCAANVGAGWHSMIRIRLKKVNSTDQNAAVTQKIK